MHSNFSSGEKTSKLLFKQACPAIIGMLIMSLYNIVDTIYIGRGAGTLALAGVSISLPIMILFLAVSLAIGVGTASLISINLSSGDSEKIKALFGNGLLIVLISSVLILSLGYAFLTPLIKFLGATPDIFPYALEYARIILMGTLFFLFFSASNNIMRAFGHARAAMISMLIGAIVNLILDPIFIFYLKMGVKGAAYSTVISWFIGAIYALYYYRNINMIRISLRNLKPKMNIIKRILSIGSASFARQISLSIMTIVINVALASFNSHLAIAAYGIIAKLTLIADMPIFGIVQGMQPIIGFNWGAKKYNTVKEALLLSVKVSSYIAIISFLILMLLSRSIVSLFTNDVELINTTVKALRIIALMFPLIGLQTVTAGLYQSIGKAKLAFFLSILKQIIFLVPLVLLLPSHYQISGIWYALPISDLLTALVTIIFIYKEISIISNLIQIKK